MHLYSILILFVGICFCIAHPEIISYRRVIQVTSSNEIPREQPKVLLSNEIQRDFPEASTFLRRPISSWSDFNNRKFQISRCNESFSMTDKLIKTKCLDVSLPFNMDETEYESYEPPEEFDPRKILSLKEMCPSLLEISDQGACESCWAVVAADVMTDRMCLISRGAIRVRYSSTDLLTCCKKCHLEFDQPGNRRAPRFGNSTVCNNPGINVQAWVYWIDKGLVSGELFDGSGNGCQRYPIEPCDHSPPDSENQLWRPDVRRRCRIDDSIKVPECRNYCDSDTNKIKAVRFYGKLCYLIKRMCDGTEKLLKTEIIKNGPIHADMIVSEDFIKNCKGGKNQICSNRNDVHLPQEGRTAHSIRIVGWGKQNDGTNYWIVANSWGTHWGEMEGFFYLDFEFNGAIRMIAGVPLL